MTLIKGEQAITEEIAEKLDVYFGMVEKFGLGLQIDYEIGELERKKIDVLPKEVGQSVLKKLKVFNEN